MNMGINAIRRAVVVATAVVAAGICTACNSAPKMTIPAAPPPSVALSPELQNNPNVPAFVKNGGLDRMHQQMLDHARMMQQAQRKGGH